MVRLLSLLALILLAAPGCASFGARGAPAPPDGPSYGIDLFVRGDFHESARVFAGVIKRSREPGQVSVRGSLRGVFRGSSEDGSLALTDTEEAVLLLLHGSALYKSGEFEKGGARARQALRRHPSLHDDLRCWALHLLGTTALDEIERMTIPGICPAPVGDFDLQIFRYSGPLRDVVEKERNSGFGLVSSVGRLALAIHGVPTPSPPDWIPGGVAIRPER